MLQLTWRPKEPCLLHLPRRPPQNFRSTSLRRPVQAWRRTPAGRRRCHSQAASAVAKPPRSCRECRLHWRPDGWGTIGGSRTSAASPGRSTCWPSRRRGWRRGPAGPQQGSATAAGQPLWTGPRRPKIRHPGCMCNIVHSYYEIKWLSERVCVR